MDNICGVNCAEVQSMRLCNYSDTEAMTMTRGLTSFSQAVMQSS